jgi:hypothetical protein
VAWEWTAECQPSRRDREGIGNALDG